MLHTHEATGSSPVVSTTKKRLLSKDKRRFFERCVPLARNVMCTSRAMFASQGMCASRVKSGAHHITLRQNRKTSLRRKPQHHLRRQRKHHCHCVSLCHWGRFPLTHLSLPNVSIRTVPVDTFWRTAHCFRRFPAGGFEGQCKVSTFGDRVCRMCLFLLK